MANQQEQRGRTIRFRGREISIKEAGRIFIRAWEESERLHLKKLIFRVPIRYKTVNGFTYEEDPNLLLTNELVYRILSMPKHGVRKTFVEAWDELAEECFDGNELVSFEPVDQDIVEWAQKKGYYLDFDELEIVDDAYRDAG